LSDLEEAVVTDGRICNVAATALSTRLPLVARSSHDFHVDNPLGGCRKRTNATGNPRSSEMAALIN
jgi:hypothetical protein